MGRGTAMHTRERDFEDITPVLFRRQGAGAVLKLADGRYAVRGEMLHSMRHGDVPEGTVIIEPEMLYETLKEEFAGIIELPKTLKK
jgi:hypothetical protein